MIGAAAGIRVCMDERGHQAWHGMQQTVLGRDGHLMSLERGRRRVDDDLALGPQLVSGPAHPDVANAEHTWRAGED